MSVFDGRLLATKSAGHACPAHIFECGIGHPIASDNAQFVLGDHLFGAYRCMRDPGMALPVVHMSVPRPDCRSSIDSCLWAGGEDYVRCGPEGPGADHILRRDMASLNHLM